MIICSCHAIKADQIKELLDQGVRDTAMLTTLSKAGSCCGGCVGNLERMLKLKRKECTSCPQLEGSEPLKKRA